MGGEVGVCCERARERKGEVERVVGGRCPRKEVPLGGEQQGDDA